ncbi:MAG: TPM domain-containing protein [Prevotella sp.]|nr:TPM domain-containing protein [Prevotella sp.]
MKTKQNISVTKMMLGALGCMIGAGVAVSAGANGGSVETAWMLLALLSTIFVPTCSAVLIADWQKNKTLRGNPLARRSELARIAHKYNSATDMLVRSYQNDKRSMGLFACGQKERLRSHYERLYYKNKEEFDNERKSYIANHDVETPESRHFKKTWTYIIAIGLLSQLLACSYTAGLMAEEDTTPATRTTLANTPADTTAWNANSIPMPHLTDGARYVSNPDHVVSSQTEQQLNRMLKRMDDSLRIESAMVIVNHVENEDVFRFAQDLFNRYKIGKEDRGMVIVLAYQDHKVRTHTGRALEADLTDIECSRLQQTYAVPFMKSEQPDSGMLYLTEAIYNLLQKKELPVTYQQKKEQESDEAAGILALHLLLIFFWFVLIAYLRNRYNGTTGRNLLRSNPFEKAAPIIVGGSGGSGGSFGGGGGFSGGGFSGGSSGGGGATSSW